MFTGDVPCANQPPSLYFVDCKKTLQFSPFLSYRVVKIIYVRETFPLKKHYVNLFVISEYLKALMHFPVRISVNESLVQIN